MNLNSKDNLSDIQICLSKILQLDKHVYSIAIMNNLLICGLHGEINIFDIYNYRLIKKLECYKHNYVRRIIIKDNLLLCSSYDDIIIWDIAQDYKHIKTLNVGNIGCMTISVEANILTGIFNAFGTQSISRWDMNEDYKLINNFLDNIKEAYCVAMINNKIIGGSRDGSISVLNMEKYINDPGWRKLRATKKLKGHTYTVSVINIKDNLIISGSWDGTLKIWDMAQNYNCIKTIETKSFVIAVAIRDNLIISASFNEIKIWDMARDYKCIITLNCKPYNISRIGVKDNLIFVISDNGKIIFYTITLFPNEIEQYQEVINMYNIPRNLKQQISNVFSHNKDIDCTNHSKICEISIP